jgi:DNA-binding CsgD family transcriptional regulator
LGSAVEKRAGSNRRSPALVRRATPSERRIAELVAEGKTNKEVAAILVVTARTVESALTQIYRRLDVPSRTELARKLDVPPEVARLLLRAAWVVASDNRR